MTHDHRHDEGGHAPHDHAHGDETRPVDRQTYVERERVVDPSYVPPAAYPPPAYGQPAGGQVNVNADARPAYVDRGPSALYYVRRVLSLLFGILTILLAIRVILLALVANQTNDIVNFVYNVTEPFVAPFRGIFRFDQVTPGGGSVLDIAAIVAFIGWLLIYLLLMAILSLADRDRPA